MTGIKKLAATLCLAALVLALPACSKENGDNGDKKAGDANGEKTAANTNANGNGNGNGTADRNGGASSLTAATDRQTTLSTASKADDLPGNARQPDRNRTREAARNQSTNPEDFIVKMNLEELDLGKIPVGQKKKGTVTLTNTGDTPMKVVKCQSSCSCTTSNCPTGQMISPGESVDIDIELKAGLLGDQQINKKMTFIIDGQPNLVLPVKGLSYAAVTMEPNRLDSATNPQGEFKLTASDGQAFSIVSISPLGFGDYATDTNTEHTVVLGEGWCEKFVEGGVTKLIVNVDHPETRQVQATIIGQCAREVIDAIRANATNRGGGDARMLSMATNGNVEALAKALETAKNVDVRDRNGATPLVLAAQNGQLEAVKLLVEKGANIEGVTKRIGSPIVVAAYKEHPEVVQYLIEQGADVNAVDANQGMTALMSAARQGNAQIVKMLLDAGATPTLIDSKSGEALAWAAGFGNAECVQLLIDAGSTLDRKDMMGFTPLTWAAGFGSEGSVAALITAGADLNIADNLDGSTPIMHAARDPERIGNLQALIAAGADVNATDRRGRSVLMIAAEKGSVEAVQLLLDRDADTTATDQSDQTALDYARMRTDAAGPAIVELLGGAETEGDAGGAGGESDSGETGDGE